MKCRVIMSSELGNDWTAENHCYTPEEKRELLMEAERKTRDEFRKKAEAVENRMTVLQHASPEELRLAHKDLLKKRKR